MSRGMIDLMFLLDLSSGTYILSLYLGWVLQPSSLVFLHTESRKHLRRLEPENGLLHLEPAINHAGMSMVCELSTCNGEERFHVFMMHA